MVAPTRLLRRLMESWRRTNKHGKRHIVLTWFWVLMIPLSIITGWIHSIVFVSAISLYANVASHWSAYEGAIPDEEADG